jgi:hypothetical protein
MTSLQFLVYGYYFRQKAAAFVGSVGRDEQWMESVKSQKIKSSVGILEGRSGVVSASEPRPRAVESLKDS